MFKIGQKTTWTLPSTTQGSRLEFLPDKKIASLFRFDAINRTITFNGQNFKSEQKEFAEKVFFNAIRLIDEN